MNPWHDFHGPNAAYVLELYDRYRQDPGSVDPATQALFDGWPPPEDGVGPESAGAAVEAVPGSATEKIAGAVNLAQAIREYGHLDAHLDPLGSPPPGDPSLDPAAQGLSEDDLRALPASYIGGPIAAGAGSALEAIQALRRVYSSTTGYDFDHIRVPEERNWLRDAAEAGRFRPPLDPLDPETLLEQLTRVEVFEQFLHRTFPGKTRFSIEGLDMLVPILNEVIAEAAEAGIYRIFIAMAHRGRLNVLAHVINKPYTQILAEFKDPVRRRTFRDDLGWTGDVKYHSGASRARTGGEMLELEVFMAPNPSHLEAVNPVVEGMARAAGTRADRPGPPQFDSCVSLPILIHGDAAFPGQGVSAETLNLSRLAGYRTGGTLHIIANNQLGYTTLPETGRSTLYASDLAKGFKIPVVHVNADDPQACIEVARLASAYRARFEKDFLIDLVGYRRYGHNEGDEPAFTQPLMYQKIESHPTVRARWADTLQQQEAIHAEWPEELVRNQTAELQRLLDSLDPEQALVEPVPEPPPRGAARRAHTAVPAERLRELHDALLRVPEGFTLHRKIERAMQRRRQALEDPDQLATDWAMAEDLAFASILADGVPIRLTGQDTERGTFSQRHAVFHDVKTGATHVPLQALPQAKAAFEIRNSPLSENAALGFEFGYNFQAPGRLVLWEAQYGDFINGAQVIVDEFLTSARSKWGQTPSLVLLLPHGYEGHGPDHSSARPERFLQSAAEMNLRLANCTTAAQYFHLLRRQAALLETDPLPLIVLTPKSLLRHPRVASSLRDLAEGGWQPAIDDAEARQRGEQVRRLILCSGKIYVDLMASEHRETGSAVAIARLEQVYPHPTADLEPVLEGYANLEEVLWVQEEPENMGLWTSVEPWLDDLIHGRWPLRYHGRRRSPSPAEGSLAWHTVNQQTLVSQAFDLNSNDARSPSSQ